jgi:hypothetical protein
VNLYSEIDFDFRVLKGIALNFIAVVGTIIVIQFLPDKKFPEVSQYNHAMKFLFLTFGVSLFTMYLSGGYEGAVTGGLNGTLISYIALFFDVGVGLNMYLFLQKKIKYVLLVIILYIGILTLAGSRSAIILILISGLILPIFENGSILKKKLKYIGLLLAIGSPILFYVGTSIREDVNDSLIEKILIGRISMVELAAIPIEARENNTMDWQIYSNKYGIVNQLQQSVNEVLPVNPFVQDVSPNQYHRAVFKGVREETILDKYMSVNLTLPTYFYLETNFFMACVLSIAFLSWLYYFWVRKSKNVYILVGIIINLYNIMYFFDWVSITGGFYRVFLSMVALNCFEWVMNIIYAGNPKTELPESVQ